MKKLLRVVIALLLLNQGLLVQAQSNQQVVDGRDYAPYIHFLEYDFAGQGNEYASQVVRLQFGVNSSGYYQFSVNNSGTQIVYVYQITDEGVIEQAYFPETYYTHDFRNHADVHNNKTSLILPRQIYEGLEFKGGYSDQDTYRVNEILSSIKIHDATYYDVVVLELVTPADQGTSLFYYAPGVGLIYRSFEHEDFAVTTSLRGFKGISMRYRDLIESIYP